MTTMGQRALAILQPLNDAAVIHIVAERVEDGLLRNIYTLVMYGCGETMHSIATEFDVHTYDARYVCLRYRIHAADVDFVTAAIGIGLLTISKYRIAYEVGEPRIGFAPNYIRDDNKLTTLAISRSSWVRMRECSKKRIGDIELSERSLPGIAKQLSFLNALRWTATNISLYPEKLGNVEEWWPTPIFASVAQKKLWVADPDDLAQSHRVTIAVRILERGLQTDALLLNGVGPHDLSESFDSVEIDLFLDEVVMDRLSSDILLSLTFSAGVAGGEQARLTTKRRREDVVLPIAPRSPTTTTIGNVDHPTLRGARDLGRRWRDQHSSSTMPRIERVYDPRPNNAVASALSDLQRLTTQPAKHIIAVDRFSLNKEALEAILALALGHPANVTIDILTRFEEFRSTPGAAPSLTERIATFRKTARYFSTTFGPRVRLYQLHDIDVHDRFLIIDTKIFHVGHSFNAIGEALSAIVEMSDIAAKAALLDILEPQMAYPDFDSDEPDASST